MRRLVCASSLLLLAACGSSDTGPSDVPMMPGSQPAPPPMASPTVAPSPSPEPQVVVLRRATFRGANGHSASGSARIERTGTRHTLELGSDFRLNNGNTDVYLARDPGTVGGRDLNLGPLPGLSGPHSFGMPDDGAQYRFVVLWCKPFRVVIGVGELR